MQYCSMNEIDKKIGEVLKRARKAKGLTQEQLAELSDCTRITVQNIENGSHSASVNTLSNICKNLEIKEINLE